jgi:hypothetical protein
MYASPARPSVSAGSHSTPFLYLRRVLKVRGRPSRFVVLPSVNCALNCCLLFHQWRQMDLELTAWQMLYLCMAPSVVYASCVYPVGCVAVCSLLLHCFSSLQLPAYDISQTCAAVSHTYQP